MKRTTIKDVAREAGVSVATVSNAMNNPEVVQPRTLEHVLETARRLDYVPNLNGKRLRGSRSHAVGLFVRSIAGTYYGNLAETVHYTLQERGYELQVYITDSVDTIHEKALSHNLDGAIIHTGMKDNERVRRLCRTGLPIVFLDQRQQGRKVSSVLYRSFEDGRTATEYLLGLGHRDLMHVFGVPGNYESEERFEGFRAALGDAGLEMREENLIHGALNREDARREMGRFLEAGHRLPQAIFAANDQSAVGCIEALRERGVRVPEDVSVIGCDDDVISALVQPGLTTVHIDAAGQAELAAREVLRLIGEDGGRIERLTGSIVERQSCRRA